MFLKVAGYDDLSFSAAGNRCLRKPAMRWPVEAITRCAGPAMLPLAASTLLLPSAPAEGRPVYRKEALPAGKGQKALFHFHLGTDRTGPGGVNIDREIRAGGKYVIAHYINLD